MLTDIEAYLRQAASYGRDTARIGPFLATFAPGSASPYVNYAIPDDGAQPQPADVSALVAAYARRDRTPRLEYLPDLAPAVEPALLAAGFTVEARMPMMVCRPAEAVPVPVPDGIELSVPRSRAEFAGVVAVPLAAFCTPADAGEYRSLVRFACCKRPEVLERAVAQLARLGATTPVLPSAP